VRQGKDHYSAMKRMPILLLLCVFLALPWTSHSQTEGDRLCVYKAVFIRYAPTRVLSTHSYAVEMCVWPKLVN